MKKNNHQETNGRAMSKHHVIPRSRGGHNDDNVVEIPLFPHQGWHSFFGNLTPEEAMEFIQIVFLGKNRNKKKKRWSQEDFYKLQIDLQQKTLREQRRKSKSFPC